jgi:hypothetical protein
MTEAMREQFEAWARRGEWPTHRGDREYADSFTECAREGYQAALRSPAVAGLVEALRGVIAVADRKTDEFDKARAALAQYATLAGESHG